MGEVSESEKIILNENEKKVSLRETRNAVHSLSTLHDFIRNNNLTIEMRETLMSLTDSYVKEIKEIINFTGNPTERIQSLNKSTHELKNKEIQELKDALKKQHTIVGLTSNIKLMFEKIEKWWDIEGFEYIKEKNISSKGYVQLTLGFLLDSFSLEYSKTPVSDEEELKTKVAYLQEKGFVFASKTSGNGYELLDTDNNRLLLEQLIKETFPSAKLYSVRNHYRENRRNNESFFVIRYVELVIYDLNDIEQLKIEEKKFLLDENE